MGEIDSVTKSNNIIEAKYKLTLNEQRIVLLMVSKIRPDDTGFRTYKMKVNDLINFLEIKNKNYYSDIKDILSGLIKKELLIKKENSLLQVAWLASAEYFVGDGYIELEFSEKLIPYLIQLREKFTTYQIKNIIHLKSTYSIRIYELLKQFQKIGTRTFELKKLREILGISEDSYKRYNDFKRKVLIKAVQEINEKTDIKITFNEIKSGRRIVAIKFKITASGKEENAKENELNERLNKLGISIEQANTLINKHPKERIIRNLDYVESVDKAKIKNLKGFTLKAINEDYAYQSPFEQEQNKKEDKKSKLNNRVEEIKTKKNEMIKEYEDYILNMIKEYIDRLPEAEKNKIRNEAEPTVPSMFLQRYRDGEFNSYFNNHIKDKYLKDKIPNLKEYAKDKGFDIEKLKIELDNIETELQSLEKA